MLGAAGFAGQSSTAQASPGIKKDRGPRAILFLVADGMSWSTLSIADQFSRRVRGRGLRIFDLFGEAGAYHATVDMRSLNSLVTDSAAASSSWGSGSRVMNGTLNMLPDGRRLRTLYDLFGTRGWARGLVTTTEITHATPAGFAASVPSRAMARQIAKQYLEKRIEILFGGGHKFFVPDPKTHEGEELFPAYRKAGYAIATDVQSLRRLPKKQRCLGVFSESHLPFWTDWNADPAVRGKVPRLLTMVQEAIPRLQAWSDRFILQIEGGRVDHAGHANDIVASVHDMIEFDEVVEYCLIRQQRNPDWLIIVTTDHGTANPGLNGMGGHYTGTPVLFAHVERGRRSFEWFARQWEKKGKKPQHLRKLIEENRHIQIPDALWNRFVEFLKGEEHPLFKGMDGLPMQLGELLANFYGVGWTSGAHTSDYVPLWAKGPGADRFVGFFRNTDVFRKLLDLVGIDFRNPSLPDLAECGPSASEVEDLSIA